LKSKEEKQLASVTSFNEEKELDSAKASQNLTKILHAEQKAKKEQRQREVELASIAIKTEDVDLIVNELEISQQQAERILREHKGDIVAALKYLVSVH